MLYIPRGPGTSERDLMDPVLADPGIVEAVEVDWCLLGIHRNFLQQHRTNFFVMPESTQKILLPIYYLRISAYWGFIVNL